MTVVGDEGGLEVNSLVFEGVNSRLLALLVCAARDIDLSIDFGVWRDSLGRLVSDVAVVWLYLGRHKGYPVYTLGLGLVPYPASLRKNSTCPAISARSCFEKASDLRFAVNIDPDH